MSAGRFHAIDRLRRQANLGTKDSEIAQRLRSIAERNETRRGQAIADDRLRLIFASCHPAIDPAIRVPLTLREVCGLTTDEIASAILVQPQTMAQRLVRGKAKIREAEIPIELPEFDHRDRSFNLGSVPVGMLVESSPHGPPVSASRRLIGGSAMLRGNDRSGTDDLSRKFVVGF